MRLEIPIPLPGSSPQPKAGPPALDRSRGTWRRVELDLGPGPSGGSDAEPGRGDDEPARYYERHEADLGTALPSQDASGLAPGQDSSGQNASGQSSLRQGAPCLLIVSPLLPLPRSLPALVEEALASEPDLRLDWKWPLLTPRAGPWELVVQLCVGTSQATGHTTGRVYVGLDAGSGAYLIVCIDRDPQKLAERHKEVLTMLAGARLHRDRIPQAEIATADSAWAPDTAAAASQGRPGPQGRQEPQGPQELPATATGAPAAPRTEILPPQQPPLEIYLKDALFSYMTD